jgi:2-keto-4-pentenoate hydratase/2-oxohepta-3-ene-1,7-dioic acid hydratase in catechol pathway
MSVQETQATLESSIGGDGLYRTTLRAGGVAIDLERMVFGRPAVTWDPARETLVDALLQSGRFEAVLGEVLDRAGSATAHGEGVEGRRTAPLVRPGKVLALGRTYAEHAIELGNAPLADPLVFDKLPDAIVGSDAVVEVPAYGAGRLDHEAELALVIGTRAWRLPPGNGAAAIAGVMAANDLTLRGVQKAAQKAGHPWLMSKSFPGSCVLGPILAPLRAGESLPALEIVCRVNGEVRQRASTASLMRPPAGLVEWLSQWIPLNPGDVILTGTPAGTGPLVPGDLCEITIKGGPLDLGKLVTRIG